MPAARERAPIESRGPGPVFADSIPVAVALLESAGMIAPSPLVWRPATSTGRPRTRRERPPCSVLPRHQHGVDHVDDAVAGLDVRLDHARFVHPDAARGGDAEAAPLD